MTAEPIWFTDRFILPLHARLIREFGGLEGLRDVNLLESALRRPIDKWNYQKPEPDLAELAAAYIWGIVRNHPFVDGNKRIAAACFLLFLERNSLLYNSAGQTIISNEALASLTLFVASSKAEEMDTVRKLLISVLNRNV